MNHGPFCSCADCGADAYYEELMRVTRGPRTYTPEQAEFIKRHVADRKPLPNSPLPITDRAAFPREGRS